MSRKKIDLLVFYLLYAITMPNASTNTMCAVSCASSHHTLLPSLYSHIKGSTWQEKLDTCNMCMCCERHQRNKPLKFEPYYRDQIIREGLTTNSCPCNCRHSARSICYYGTYHLLSSAPDARDLPMPPLKWTAPDDDLTLLDEATGAALEHYWKGQVKACQYAIFHIC